jgi:hypothetical protein
VSVIFLSIDRNPDPRVPLGGLAPRITLYSTPRQQKLNGGEEIAVRTIAMLTFSNNPSIFPSKVKPP